MLNGKSKLRENVEISHKKWTQLYTPPPTYDSWNLNYDGIIHVEFGYLRD